VIGLSVKDQITVRGVVSMRNEGRNYWTVVYHLWKINRRGNCQLYDTPKGNWWNPCYWLGKL